MTTIRILVADDHALVREGIRLVLDAEPEFEVVAEAANGRQAVDLALIHRPDVVVLDITMPEETGLSAAARLRDLLPSIPTETAFEWTGTFAETKDGLPFIGRDARYPGFLFALGYGGNGITYSMIAAGIIRDLYLGRANADAQLFRFGR